MAAPVPINEPFCIAAGDTLKFTKSLAYYSANDGWALTYTFRGPTTVNITASTSGGDFSVTQNNAFATPGTYYWTAYVAKSGERYQVDKGTLKVEPDLSSGSGIYDGRSDTKIRLDAIEAAITSLVAGTISSFSEGGISYTKKSLTELYPIRDKIRTEYLREVAAEQTANGLGGGRMVYTRFGNRYAPPGYPYWAR